MEKPIIAVLGGHHSAGHDQYDCVDHVYCERIVEAGALPILLPAAEDDTGLAQLLRLCSGMLLPGGADVDPRFYHQEPLPQLGALDSALDRYWIAAVRMAKSMGLPMLGICRGTQLTNVALGGSLIFPYSVSIRCCTHSGTVLMRRCIRLHCSPAVGFPACLGRKRCLPILRIISAWTCLRRG